MKLNNYVLSILAGAACLSGCKDEVHVKSTPIKAFYESKRYQAQAKDGSSTVVWERGNGTFQFLRDRDNDGWADSMGKGINWLGVANVDQEEELTPKKIPMNTMSLDEIFRHGF